MPPLIVFEDFSLKVHARCYGELEPLDGVLWFCNLCRPGAPKSPRCCLCPVTGIYFFHFTKLDFHARFGSRKWCLTLIAISQAVQLNRRLMGAGLIWHVPCGFLVCYRFSFHFLIMVVFSLWYEIKQAATFSCFWINVSAETCLVDVKRMEPIDGLSRINKVRPFFLLLLIFTGFRDSGYACISFSFLNKMDRIDGNFYVAFVGLHMEHAFRLVTFIWP